MTIRATVCTLAVVAVSALSASARAADFWVEDLFAIQSIQTGATPMVAGNATYIRAEIGYDGPLPSPHVHGVLRMWVDGELVDGAPFHSVNGAIPAVGAPNLGDLDETMQFLVVLPESDDIEIEVEINPTRSVPEDDFTNNRLAMSTQALCRATVELAYVPIDYQPGGLGVPNAALIEPGIGDGFVRAIYSAGEWNYHRSPLPPLVWSSNINNSASALLNALQDIRVNQLPAQGYGVPTFVYGWLPDNPYSGNGAAQSVPGDVAFGNTQPIRHQRTFAHELGHLYGLFHNGSMINTVGVDIEHHLLDTQGLAQVFLPSKNDIMVAGQLTNTAYVRSATYMTALNDSRMQCLAAAGVGMPVAPLLRVSGVFDFATRSATLDPVTWIERGEATRDDAEGDIVVEAVRADGAVLVATKVATHRVAPSCAANGNERADFGYHVMLPALVEGGPIQSIRVRDLTTGAVLQQRTRSQNPPAVTAPVLAGAGPGVDPGGGDAALEAPTGLVNVTWEASDADGDALTFNLMYSHDGSSWVPLVVNHTEAFFEFDTTHVAASDGEGILRVIATDGLNIAMADLPGVAMGSGAAPAVYFFTPNDDVVVSNAQPIVLHGAAWDLEDRMLTEGIEWWVAPDRFIGSGPILMFDDLPVGTNTVIMRATDSDGQSSERTRSIVVEPRDVFGADINGDAVVDVADLSLLITHWGDCADGWRTCPEDVSGDGTVSVFDLIQVIARWGPMPE